MTQIFALFAFENLEVYLKVKSFNNRIFNLIESSVMRPYLRDQLGRAALSTRLNIAEGSARFSSKDQRHFLVIARGSSFECLSLLEYLKDNGIINTTSFEKYYHDVEEISKMLYVMIRKLEKRDNHKITGLKTSSKL